MIKEAEAHASEDRKKRELVEARNHLDALIHSTEKSLADSGDKVSAAVKSEVQDAISRAKEAAQADDVERIKSATQALAQASLKIGEAIYGSQQAAGGGAGGESAEHKPGNENVVDADFEEVKDDKKKSG